ncbi:MAG: hypothetical protein CVV05_05590 [Gammaproteobacteria bacterium HGW-Gammaproteobacteria-1]|jgi:hypothetical protein|nr:MAG: hypothetical protein CVV05_05590 [Gammaproteobacteria bacterium HGW-Gammaproteobacteria-1]
MSDYLQQYDAPLAGLLHWPQWDTLTAALQHANDGGWYVYYVGEEVPEQPLPPERFAHVIGELDRLLRRDHQEPYLGIVYVDDAAQPAFVKIYDPNHLGSSCGSSGRRVLPGWTLSRCPPVDLHAAVANPGGRRRWWQSLFA